MVLSVGIDNGDIDNEGAGNGTVAGAGAGAGAGLADDNIINEDIYKHIKW